jgi:NhaC family Na+:H+ antiporter
VAFLLSAVLSFALGTSMGVTGTAGLVLVTLARSGGVSLAMTAGAVLSGAYFGDRCSPMSSCATLVAACTDTELYRNVREMLRTGVLPTVLSTLFYGILSFRNPITTVDGAVLATLSEHFSLHWVVLLPALVMLVLPLAKVPVKRAMLVSTAIAFVLTTALQGMPALDALRIAVLGYHPPEAALSAILSGGGIISMAHPAAVVFVTGLYAGILEGTDTLSPARHWAEKLASRVGLFPASVLVSTAIAAVFCNQSVTILIGEQLLASSYQKQGASRTEQAIDIANSGVMIAGIVPWSIALTVPLAMLGVGLEALPYGALLYLTPLCYLFTKRYFRAGQNTAPAERH